MDRAVVPQDESWWSL